MLQGGILPLLETLSKSPTQVDHQVIQIKKKKSN